MTTVMVVAKAPGRPLARSFVQDVILVSSLDPTNTCRDSPFNLPVRRTHISRFGAGQELFQ